MFLSAIFRVTFNTSDEGIYCSRTGAGLFFLSRRSVNADLALFTDGETFVAKDSCEFLQWLMFFMFWSLLL